MTDIRSMIREEIRSSVGELIPPQYPPAHSAAKRPRYDQISDSEQESEGLSGSDSQEMAPAMSMDEDKKYQFASDNMDFLLKAVRETMNVEEIEPSRSVQDEMFGGLTARKRRVFLVNNNLQKLILAEWEDSEKRLFIPREFKDRLVFDPEDIKLWQETPKIDVPVAKVI
ncbi:hypothetical protein PRIEUP_LOCUS16409 [Pristimantis euphronides]